MAYEVELAAFLSGATRDQIRLWDRKGLVVPEVQTSRPKLYSFRDVVALRTIAKLRAFVPLQKIRKAIDELQTQELTEHLSEYRFATDSRSVKVWTEDGFMDLNENPGQWEFVTLSDIYAPFENFNGREVNGLFTPFEGIEVNPKRMGGEPTIAGTRVPYSLITDLSSGEDPMTAEEIAEYYPSVKADQVPSVLAFDQAVKENVA